MVNKKQGEKKGRAEETRKDRQRRKSVDIAKVKVLVLLVEFHAADRNNSGQR